MELTRGRKVCGFAVPLHSVELLSRLRRCKQRGDLLACSFLGNTQTDVIPNHALLNVFSRHLRWTIRKQCSLIRIATSVGLEIVVDHSNQRPLFLSHHTLSFRLTVNLLVVESFFDFFASLRMTVRNGESELSYQ